MEEKIMLNTDVSLYNDNKIDFSKEPIFFGTGKNTQRFEDPKYPFFDKSNLQQQGQDWMADEIPLTKDRSQFKTIFKDKIPETFVTTRNFQKLIFLDSLNGRGPFLILGQLTTLPEFENVTITWDYFEAAKHSRTYTEELRALYDNPEEIFNESFEIPELLEIAKSISTPFEEAYYETIGYIYKRQRGIEITREEMDYIKEKILMVIIEINALEGIRFYPGFAAIWSITEGQGYLPGSSENLQFICRDENTHLALTQYLLKLLRTIPEEGFVDIYKKNIDKITARYYQVYKEEKKWIQYIFSEGSYIGMNEDILIQYLNYITIRRMKAIGLKPTKEGLDGLYITKNPLPWIEKYINMDKNEKLPQEEKVLNYLTGAVEQDIENHQDLDFIKELL